MGTLQDALLRAGKVKQADVDHADSARRATERQGRRRISPADERLSRPARSDHEQAAADTEATALAEAHRLAADGRAGKRWYFVARGGKLGSLETADNQGEALERGRAAIAQSPTGRTWVVTSAGATALEALDPAWVRFRVI